MVLEVEVSARLSEGLSIDSSISYTAAEYDEFFYRRMSQRPALGLAGFERESAAAIARVEGLPW